MARANKSELRLDTPKGLRQSTFPTRGPGSDRFGRFTESIARGMGTPWFLVGLTVFAVGWMLWNTLAPEQLRFDSISLGFIALTLMLSLQASYAAPMILLAQNRQDDRDRVQIEQDRQRAERNLADTEYLAREVVALRLAIKDMASKDFIRAELRSLIEHLDERDESARAEADAEAEAVAAATASAAAAPRPVTASAPVAASTSTLTERSTSA